ncbi:MAG: hypothetical protein KJI71_01465 [Patescibacteria group bacterium]|nr:hypothetical protein [Patescibacteria group bacterium]
MENHKFKLSENVIFFQSYPLPKSRPIQAENIPEKELMDWDGKYRGKEHSIHEHVGYYFKQNGVYWD